MNRKPFFAPKVACIILCLSLLFDFMQFAPLKISAISINDPSVFLIQETSYTCTLASAAMMMRRRAILDGENWQAITESSLRPTAWMEDVGLYHSFSFQGISVGNGSFSNVVSDLVPLLSQHPEGIVIYNTGQPHAILVTDYDSSTGNFYCADPMLNSGRIPVGS